MFEFFKRKPSTVDQLPGDIIEKIGSDFAKDTEKAFNIIDEALSEFEYLRSARIIRCILFLANKDIPQLYRSIDNASTYPDDVIVWAEYINKASLAERKRVRNFKKRFDRNDLTLRD